MWIELESADGTDVFININRITAVEPSDKPEYCIIHMGTGHMVTVKRSYESVTGQLKVAARGL